MNKRSYKNYTDQDIITNASKVESLSGLLKSLGLKPAGGNFVHMKKNLQRLNLDCGHWKGQGWNKGQHTKSWENYTDIRSIKKLLIRERGYYCERCRRDLWEGFQIVLEIHHVDGDRSNNNRDNLKLLCCNCHSTTPQWRRGNGR